MSSTTILSFNNNDINLKPSFGGIMTVTTMDIFRLFLFISTIILLNAKETEEVEVKTKYCFGFDNVDKTNIDCILNQNIIGNIEILKSREIIIIKCMNNNHNPPTEEEINWPQMFQDLNITTYYHQQKLELAQFENCIAPDIPLSQLFTMMRIPATSNITFKSKRRNKFLSYHFKNLYSVSKIILSNNDLVDLPSDLLEGLPNLKDLYLTMNRIRYIPETFLQYCPELHRLDIGYNVITTLPSKLFKNTSKLKILLLFNNRLKDSLTENTFEYLKQLVILDLSSNDISSLDSNIFYHTKNLKEINLSFNNLANIPQGLFSNCPSLKKVRMEYSKITQLPSGLFENLNLLEQVGIQMNLLKELPENLFHGCERLEEINMSGNKLKNLSGNIFKDLIRLRTLDISSNELETLDESLFNSQHNLRKLILRDNHLTTIPESVFLKLRDLESLDLSYNRLTNIEHGALHNLFNLRTAIFSHNSLTFQEISEYSSFQKCLNLEELNLESNLANTIYDDWLFFTKIRKLNLSKNKLETLNADELQFASAVTVDLSSNKIEVVDLQRLEMLASSQCITPTCDEKVRDRKVLVKLGNNPIVCDCKSYYFLSYVQQQMKPSAYAYVQIDADELLCNDDTSKNKPVHKIDIYSVTCSISEVADQPIDCVPNCDCLFRPKDDALVIDCKNKSFTKMPAIIPSAPFIKRTELDLKNNEIQHLDNMDEYHTVTKLELSNNRISQISPSIISSNLTVLHLDNNQLSSLDKQTLDVLSQNGKLEVLTLHGNPWKCEDCSAQNLHKFLVKQHTMVPNITEIKCDDELEHQIFYDDLCKESPLQIVYVSISIAMFGLTVGAMIAFYYRYQHEIHVWLFAHKVFLWLVTEAELDRSKKYDAFISYSHLDEDFIVESLVPELERGPHPFKICLHFRDWIVGEWIPNQIVRSVEESRRTIVVLSPNFLNSVWGKMEFRTAHLTALKEGRARVIIIMYKELGPTEKLDAELRAYLNMNTYVKWGDPWFWNKLRYALPHPPELCKALPIAKAKDKMNPKHGYLSFKNRLSLMSRKSDNETDTKKQLAQLDNQKRVDNIVSKIEE